MHPISSVINAYFLKFNDEKNNSLFRSSGGYESGSRDTEEQLSTDLEPQIIGFPAMLYEQIVEKKA